MSEVAPGRRELHAMTSAGSDVSVSTLSVRPDLNACPPSNSISLRYICTTFGSRHPHAGPHENDPSEGPQLLVQQRPHLSHTTE